MRFVFMGQASCPIASSGMHGHQRWRSFVFSKYHQKRHADNPIKKASSRDRMHYTSARIAS